MAEDVYIAGLGPGVPEWSNEATQQQVLNALNSGFSSNVQVNRQIMTILSNISRDESESSDKLAAILTGIKKTEGAIKKGNATDVSNSNTNKKQTGFLASLTNLFSESNRTAKRQLDVTKRIAEYEKQGLTTSEANLRANIESSANQAGSLWGDAKKVLAGIMAAVGAVSTANSKTIEGSANRFNLAQGMRQSGLLAGMDAAGAGLLGLSKTISRSNFTFGEADKFTKQFSQAVGVKGVQASMQFANTLAKSGEGNSDMMQRFGMEFSEVADIAGTYMESVRSIGQLDKLSDNQMRMGMDNFMDTVVSTSNVMKINLQDAANMIAETLKQDQFASQLALMEPEMRKNVEAMVGRFGGEGTILGSGIATAMAAGSTQDFLQTDVAQQLQGDVIGQQLLPLITQMADTARTQGPDAANALYATMGPQFESIIQFARENKALVNLDEGMARALITQLAAMGQTIAAADDGAVETSTEDKAIVSLIEAQRFASIAKEATETLVLSATDLGTTLNQFVESSLILTRSTAELSAATSSFTGGVRKVELSLGTIANMTLAGGAQFALEAIPFKDRTGVTAAEGMNVADGERLAQQARVNSGGTVSDTRERKLEQLDAVQRVIDLVDTNLGEVGFEMVEAMRSAQDQKKMGLAIKEALADKMKDDYLLLPNWFNSDETKQYNEGIDKLLAELAVLVNSLR